MPLLLTETDVKAILTMSLAMEAVEESFRRLADGTAIVQSRTRLHLPGQSFLHYMAAGDAASGYMGMKIYTTSREGARFLVPLIRAQSGEWLALIEANYLGQMRTGAASGVATRWMAREDARTAGIIGTGLQARTQLEAITTARKLDRIRAFGRDANRRDQFAREMTDRLGIPVSAVSSAEEAVRDADIVVTSTSSVQPVLEGRWLKPGMHINAIGSNYAHKSELDGEAVVRADFIAVDSLEQAKIEAGELIQVFGKDAARWESVHELSEIITGRVAARTTSAQITLFKSCGVATEDIAVAGRIYEIAKERRIGREIPMWESE
jgi:ornithine cyclodeaminase/alanine dehydrogenase-like protein (mu-crystallin family)